MKIWIFDHYATPPEYGSYSRQYALSKELNKLGHNVTVIAAKVHHLSLAPSAKVPGICEFWRDNHTQFLLLPTSTYSGNGIGRLRNMGRFVYECFKLQKHIDSPPDVIIGSSPHPFAVWAAERLATQYQVPFCFEVRDLWPQTLIDMKTLSKKHPLVWVLSYLESYLYKKADRILALLPYAYEYISQFGIPGEKIHYLPNGVDLDLFQNFPTSESRPKENLTVMYLGSHGVANGLDTLLEAAAELEKKPASKRINWRFIGEGNCKSRLKEKAKELELESVTFEKAIPKSEVPSTIATADILVANLLDLGIYKYGISLNKLFDYLAAQRPIVFGCAARNNPVAEAGAGTTVPPEDPFAMAEAIRKLVDLSPEERSEIGRRGRVYVEKNHSYQFLANKLNEILESLI